MPNDPHKAAKPKDKDSSMAKKEAAKVQESQRVELPTAKDLMKQIAQKEAEKASEYMRHEAAGQAEKKALIERLSKPSGVSDEEALRRVMRSYSGPLQTEYGSSGTSVPQQSLYRWWSRYQQLGAGWENTLTGLAKEMYRFWEKHLRAKGYRLRCQIVDFSQGDAG